MNPRVFSVVRHGLNLRVVVAIYVLAGLIGALAWHFGGRRVVAPAVVVTGAMQPDHAGFNRSILAPTRQWSARSGEASVLEFELGPAAPPRGVVFSYRAEGFPLNGIRARLLRRSMGEDKEVEAMQLFGTSPGFVRQVLGRRSGLAGAAETKSVLRLELAAPARSARLEIGPMVPLTSDLRFDLARNGWLIVLWQHPWWYGLALLPAVAWAGMKIWRLNWLAKIAGLVLLAAMAAPAVHFAGATRGGGAGLAALLAVGWAAVARFAWFFQPTQALSEYFPAPAWISPEWLQRLLTLEVFQGNATASGDPAKLGAIETWLRHSAETFPPSVVKSLSLLLPLGILVLAFRPWKRLPPVSSRLVLTVAVMISGMLLWVIHPSWQLPIRADLGYYLGHGLLLLIGVQMLAVYLGLSAEGVAPAQPLAEGPQQADRWLALALGIAAVVVHLPWLGLPPTIESDETNGMAQAAQIAEIFGTDIKTMGRVAWGALLTLGLVAGVAGWRLHWRRSLAYGSFLFVGLLTLAYGWGRLALQPVFKWSDIGLYRYPPGVRYVEGVTASMGNGSMEWNRLVCAIFAAAGAAVLFWAARTLAISRAAAAGGTVLYFTSQLVFYWSSFGYYTGFFLLGHALLFLCWARWRIAQPGGQGWLLTGIWLATLLYFVHQSGIAALLAFLPMAGLVILFQRSINWRDVICLVAGTVAVVPWVQLWQNGIVGSWFGWVGRTIPWNFLLYKLADNYCWSLPAWTLFNANGLLWLLLLLGGIVVGLLFSPHRLLAALCVTMILTHGILQIMVGRMSEYDGYSRFVMVLVLPAALLAMLVFDAVGRCWPRGRYWLPLAVLGLVVARGNYRVERQPHVVPADLAPNTQANGGAHGFFPEHLVIARVPQIPLNEIGVLVPSNIFGSRVQGMNPHGVTDRAALLARLRQSRCRYLITLEPKNDATFFRYFNIVYRWPPDAFERKMIESPRTYFADWRLVADIDYWNYRILLWDPKLD